MKRFKVGDIVRFKSHINEQRWRNLYVSSMYGQSFVITSFVPYKLFNYKANFYPVAGASPWTLSDEDLELDPVYGSSLMKALRDA